MSSYCCNHPAPNSNFLYCFSKLKKNSSTLMKRLLDLALIIQLYYGIFIWYYTGQVIAAPVGGCFAPALSSNGSLKSLKRLLPSPSTPSSPTAVFGKFKRILSGIKDGSGARKTAEDAENSVKPVAESAVQETRSKDTAMVEYSANHLGAEQLEKLRLWKLEPGVSLFIEQLELYVTRIVDEIKKIEVNVLSSEQFDELLKIFASNEDLPEQKVTNQAHGFIKDVYFSRINSFNSASIAHSYFKHEYQMYTSSPQLMLGALLTYVNRLYLKAIEHYEEHQNLLMEWGSQMKEIRQSFKTLSEFGSSDSELVEQQMRQVKARSGAKSLFETLRTSADNDVPLHDVQQHLLKEVKGIFSKNTETLFFRTNLIHEDLYPLIFQSS